MTVWPIRVGSLEVAAHFERDVLHRIELPPVPPADLALVTVSGLLTKLEAHPICLDGYSRFHRAVWNQMRLIPAGQTRTYTALAQACGSPKACRAVGQACGANPLPLLIPCHRVVAANGLGGFSAGLAWKRALLALEGAYSAEPHELVLF